MTYMSEIELEIESLRDRILEVEANLLELSNSFNTLIRACEKIIRIMAVNIDEVKKLETINMQYEG